MRQTAKPIFIFLCFAQKIIWFQSGVLNSYQNFVESFGNEGLKIMFVGNSITRHGPKAEIGWNYDYGMAASSREKDYVHIVMNAINQKVQASYCICQVAEWERQYKNGEEVLRLYKDAKQYDADIIVMRCIENCPVQGFDSTLFEDEYKKILQYFNPKKRAKVILTTGFWKHPGDNIVIKIGLENDYKCVFLGDLGENEKMKAVGLFVHEGVANHPGDMGMRKIAERIYDKIQMYLPV